MIRWCRNPAYHWNDDDWVEVFPQKKLDRLYQWCMSGHTCNPVDDYLKNEARGIYYRWHRLIRGYKKFRFYFLGQVIPEKIRLFVKWFRDRSKKGRTFKALGYTQAKPVNEILSRVL